MKKYSSAVPGHIMRRFQRWFMSGLLLILLAVLIALISLALWFFNQQNEQGDQPVSRGETTVNNPFRTFKTDYFTFKTDKTWRYIKQESSQNVYVYRSLKHGLVLRDLTVYVNTLPPNLLLTSVLSAETNENRFQVRKVSSHCLEALPKNYLETSRDPVQVTIDGVSFTCQADNDQTIIGTGITGNGLKASLTRNNGQTASYFLLYHDLEFSPKPSIFKGIVEDFKSR